MEKILVTGGSHAELPLIDALHKMGYYVITTGSNKEGLGHKKADLYVCGDFSDKQFILSLAEKYNVSGIISGCNDFAYLSTAYACEKLGLPGHDSPDVSRTIHHKDLFRSLLKELGMPYPRNKRISSKAELKSVCDEIGFPLLIKPVDLTGGKGVRICGSFEEASAAYRDAIKATRETFVIAEQMIQGENHGVSALVCDHRTVFAFFDNEEYYLNKYLVSGAYAPADVPEAVRENVIGQINTIAEKLKLKDGLFHCQCIMTGNGEAYLIDPCRRAPGDLYIKLVEYSSGIKYSEAIVRSELGLGLGDLLKDKFADEKCIARECIMTDRTGVFRGISFDNELKKHLFDSLVWAVPGEPVEDFMKYKAGIAFFAFDDRETMKTALSGLYDKMKILFDKEVEK